VGVESKLGPLGTSATHWPIVPAPGDCENGEFGGMNGRGNPDVTLSTTYPSCPDPRLIPGRRGGKPASNRFSYGAAKWRGLVYDLLLLIGVCNYGDESEIYCVLYISFLIA
jgi:hypothetical protein